MVRKANVPNLVCKWLELDLSKCSCLRVRLAASVDTHWPVAGSQILTVPWPDADAIWVASFDQAVDITRPI